MLSEESVPSGYEKAADITISVSSNGSVTIDGKPFSGSAIEMIIDARKPYILPSTGGNGESILLFLSPFFSLLLFALSLCGRKGEE